MYDEVMNSPWEVAFGDMVENGNESTHTMYGEASAWRLSVNPHSGIYASR